MEVYLLGGSSPCQDDHPFGELEWHWPNSSNLGVPVSKVLLMQSANAKHLTLHSFNIFVGISPTPDLSLLRS